MQRLMLRAIEGYQRAFEGRPSPCRFFPSCSEYGHEAITVHGAGRGFRLTVRRLLRCRPLGPSGFDPVPLPRTVSPVARSSSLVSDAPRREPLVPETPLPRPTEES